MIRGLINNFRTTLDGAITNVATTITVFDVTGIATELATVADFVPMTIDNGSSIEIVYVTGVSGLVLTVMRGQEGTTGTAFASGTKIECRLTRDSILERALAGGGGGEWAHTSTQTLGSAVASVVFNISDGLAHKIIMDTVVHNSTADLEFTVAIAGPTYQTTNYKYTQQSTTSNSSSVSNAFSNSAASIILASSLGADATKPFNGWITFNPKLSGQHFMCEWSVTNNTSGPIIRRQQGSGAWTNVTDTLTEVKMAVSAGTFSIGSKFHLLTRTF